jgi:hypothetical protein
MVLCYNGWGGPKIGKIALCDMWGDVHKLRNPIFSLKRYVIYGCLLSHHKQSKLINCNVIPLYLVRFAVVLQFKICLKYFIRNIHGYIKYPTYWISIAGFWSWNAFLSVNDIIRNSVSKECRSKENFSKWGRSKSLN